jgi:uncharacterized repeat protein (TIGR03803 family)
MPTPNPKTPKLSHILSIALLLAGIPFLLGASAYARTESTIYNFGTVGPRTPQSGLVFDASGNLFGVTPYGGANNHGAVYELTPGSGGWEETVIYSFTGGADGGSPYATPIFDSAGNLYGTAAYGGNLTSSTCGSFGCGVVYKLTPGSGGWTETVLYTFTGGKDGGFPISGNLVLDQAGNLFGSNVAGGNVITEACQNTSGCGVLFQLSPVNGEWKFTIVHTFTGSRDGVGPAGLAFSPAGILFGSAAGAWGGFESPSEPGLIFAIVPLSGGGWKETVIYAFGGGTDGGLPSTPVFDKAGNIYGSGADGGIINNCWGGYGPIGCGVVFKISPLGGGKWQESVLYAFTGGIDGNQPDAGLVFDKGSLYGTTWSGGVSNGSATATGVLFGLSPQPGGGWKEHVAQSFTGSNGSIPLSKPVVDAAGNLYGTTLDGGADGFGVIFEVTP